MTKESGKELDPEVLEFLGSGDNMKEAPLVHTSFPVINREEPKRARRKATQKETPPESTPLEDADEEKNPLVHFLVSKNEKEMPLAPKGSRTGARR